MKIAIPAHHHQGATSDPGTPGLLERNQLNRSSILSVSSSIIVREGSQHHLGEHLLLISGPASPDEDKERLKFGTRQHII